jgi:parvulin-like peptidyl-prolyl isomerase
MVKEQHRVFLSQIFVQKKVYPRVQITAQDMREYYQANLEREFTEHEQMRFRIIRIDPANVGGKEAAIQRVKDIQERAAQGFDFAELARTYNTDSALARTGGLSDWTDRGAMRAQKLEAELLKIQPGQVTQQFVQEDDGSFYVAKLEDRRLGRVAPFEDPAVQDRIYATMRAEQLRSLLSEYAGELEEQAIVEPRSRDPNGYDPMLELVVQMAMQRYAQWAAAPNP